MAFQFQHLKDSINDTLEAICQVSCNPSNQSGFCLAPCWEICPSVCVDPLSHHPPLTPPPHNSASPTKLLVILFTILASASLALFIYFCYAKRRPSRSRAPPPLVTQTRHDFLDEDHGPVLDHPIWYIRTVGLQASVIESIAVFRYRKGDGLVELTDCSVCLSEFQEEEVLRLLPKCSHAFHVPCIDTWLRSHTNCPFCRAPVALPPPRAPSTEVNSGNSSVSGEPQVDTSEENREPQWEIQFQAAGCEIESNTREMEEGLAIEVGCTEGERSSISFDSSEASKISQAIALNSSEESPTGEMRSENQLAKGKEGVGLGSDSKRIGGSQRFLRLVGSSPIGRSLQSGPIFLKRSVSCYGESSFPTSRS